MFVPEDSRSSTSTVTTDSSAEQQEEKTQMGIMAFLSAVTVTNTVLQALLDGSPSQVLMFELFVLLHCRF